LLTPKPLFGENFQLKPMVSVSAYLLMTDKDIITKLDQNVKLESVAIAMHCFN